MKKKTLTLMTPVLLFSCKTVQNGSELAASPPADLSDPDHEKYTSCPLNDHPAGSSAKTANLFGQDIEYFSSDTINYENTSSWWKESNPWISADIFNSSVLGYPGARGSSRGDRVSWPANIRITAIDVRKINGKLHYHYFSNETANNPIENWSSTKPISIVMSAHALREESKGNVGLWSKSNNGYVGTHITTVAYNSDNGTANWLRSIAGNEARHNFAKNWLDSTSEFGGNYASAMAPYGNTFVHADASLVSQNPGAYTVTIAKAGTDKRTVASNTLRPIAMAEFWKRMATNVEDPKTWIKKAPYGKSFIANESQRRNAFYKDSQNFSLKEEDLRVFWYGANATPKNGGFLYGATKTDSLIDVFGGKSKLDGLTRKWRILGKTGSGSHLSTSRKRNEAALGGFVCLPAGNSLKNNGHGRLLVFFINVQTQPSGLNKYGVRNTVLKNWFSTMVPEMFNTQNNWKS